jgi:hypothetical protein
MCEVRSREKIAKKKPKKIKYNGQQQKEMDYDEPHLTLNEKTQPIQWKKWPTSALVAVGSLWPTYYTLYLNNGQGLWQSFFE